VKHAPQISALITFLQFPVHFKQCFQDFLYCSCKANTQMLCQDKV